MLDAQAGPNLQGHRNRLRRPELRYYGSPGKLLAFRVEIGDASTRATLLRAASPRATTHRFSAARPNPSRCRETGRRKLRRSSSSRVSTVAIDIWATSPVKAAPATDDAGSIGKISNHSARLECRSIPTPAPCPAGLGCGTDLTPWVDQGTNPSTLAKVTFTNAPEELRCSVKEEVTLKASCEDGVCNASGLCTSRDLPEAVVFHAPPP